jgi:hypothetical protein
LRYIIAVEKIPENSITTATIAAWWSIARPITAHGVHVLCDAGRIPGAVNWSGRWFVPADAVDPRKKRGWPKGKKRKMFL